MKSNSMLSALAKNLGLVPDMAVATVNVPDKVQAEIAKLNADLAALQAEASEVSAALATAVEAVKAADAKVAEMQAAVEAAVAAKAEAEKIVADMKVSARKSEIVAAVGEAQADAILFATEGLDDAKFKSVLAAFGTAQAKESESTMFTEQGVAGLTDGSVDEVSEEMKILRKKYNQTAAK